MLLDQMEVDHQRLEAVEDKLRSEFRCRGLTDAEIASEFAALAAGENPLAEWIEHNRRESGT